MITLADMTTDARIRRDPVYARRAVFTRDHGVCSICGLDTEALLSAWRVARNQATGQHGGRMVKINQLERAASALLGIASAEKLRGELKAINDRLVDLGFTPNMPFWQMHHVDAVAEGGGGCGLDGLQTCCIPCHVAETTALRARLKRRPTKHVQRACPDRRGRL